jgi:septum formation protein
MTFDCIKELARKHQLVLGSRSPRRVKLLTEMGIAFEQMVSTVDEQLQAAEDPFAYAERLAREKALWVSERCDPKSIVLGCDTVVVLNGSIMDKPSSEQEAFETLKTLSGNTHTVATALALVRAEWVLAKGHEKTTVVFNEVTEVQIRDYIQTGEPMDKAGAYGIQGMGGFLVDRIEGNLDNVIGLPRNLLDRLAGAVPGICTEA